MSEIVDLGDFIPKIFKVRFSINGTEYSFEFGEASVDDVLRLLAENKEEDGMEEVRRVTTEFLVKYAGKETDKEKLREDLKLVPFQNEEGLDIETLYSTIRQRYLKKGRGDVRAPRNRLCGWLGRLLS